MIRDSVELNVPEAVASADITEDYSVILSGTRDRMPRRGLDRNEGVVARKKWACIFRLDPRISFRTNEIYNISVNYSTSFVTEFYIKINEIDNSRNSLKNWKKSFFLSRIKYITISSEEEEISRSNSLSLRPPPLETPPIIRQLRLHSVVRDRFQEGWFRLINMAGYRVFQGLDDRCCRIPPPFAPSGHPRGAKKKKEKKGEVSYRSLVYETKLVAFFFFLSWTNT